MKVALDTNAYSDFLRGAPDRVVVVRKARRIYLPLFVLGELRAGFAAGNRNDENLAILKRFLKSPRVTILFPDEETTHHYASLFVLLKKAGKPIPGNDLWIAALAVQHNLPLCTSDVHFDHVPGLIRC